MITYMVTIASLARLVSLWILTQLLTDILPVSDIIGASVVDAGTRRLPPTAGSR